jgi:hypothetical protein
MTQQQLASIHMDRLRLTEEVVESEEGAVAVALKLTQQRERHRARNVVWEGKRQQWAEEKQGLLEAMAVTAGKTGVVERAWEEERVRWHTQRVQGQEQLLARTKEHT